MTKAIRKKICVSQNISKELCNVKGGCWGIYHFGSYRRVYLYPKATFKTHKEAKDFLKKGNFQVGRWIILAVKHITEIRSIIANERVADKKTYAVITKEWLKPTFQFHGTIKACDIKHAKELIGTKEHYHNFFIIPLRKSNNRIQLKAWFKLNNWFGTKTNIVENFDKRREKSLILNKGLRLYKSKLENIRPTDEELVAEAI